MTAHTPTLRRPPALEHAPGCAEGPEGARREGGRGERELPRPVCPTLLVDIPAVLAAMPETACIMTAAFEQRRGGLLIRNIMRCGFEPPAVAVAVYKGHHLSTLIRDSHGFAVNVIDPTRKLLVRKFAQVPPSPAEEDPFDTLETRRFATGAPILGCAQAAFECEVLRHFDLESDHEMYVGQVIAAKVFSAGEARFPALRVARPELTRVSGADESSKAPVRRGEDTRSRVRPGGGGMLPGQRVPASVDG